MKRVLSILFALALVLAFCLVTATAAAANGPPVTSGLVLHLDADAITGLNDGDPVATWADLSGNSNDATQGTSGYRPLYKTNILNGKPVVRFDGTDDYLGTTWDDHLARYTAFVVFQAAQDVGSTIQCILNRRTSFQVNWGHLTSTYRAVVMHNDGDWRPATFSPVQRDTFYLLTGCYDGTAIRAFRDGTLIATTLAGDPVDSGVTFTIGARDDGAFTFPGDIAEILIYDRALSDGERQQVEQYLGIKWLATCIATATSTGTACFHSSPGTIEDLTAVSVPPGAPANIMFPHGMFSFKVTGLNTGQTVTLTIELPDPVPTGTKWWKYQGGSWYPMDIGDDDGDNIITVTLTDNGLGDEDDTPGQILDDGGPGNPGTVGWETYPVSKLRVLLPWIALVAAVAAGTAILARRQRAQS